MIALRILFVLIFLVAGVYGFVTILWNNRLKHVWPKRDEIKIVNPSGWLPGILEVLFQTRVLANRPAVGFAHLLVFYGFLAFGFKSFLHVLHGLGLYQGPPPAGYVFLLDIVSWVVLAALAGLAFRRYVLDKDRMTHMVESGFVLGFIAVLMITHLAEHLWSEDSFMGQVNWWLHFLALVAFPSLIAHGKHLHLVLGPVNVVLRHMVELPEDRAIFGADFDMEDEEHFEEEYARVGMAEGALSFSFHTLFDPACCIECGRCNDACPSGPELKPRDHFVLPFRDPTLDSEKLAEIMTPDVLATCTQCRACDTVCPVGNRPSRTAMEMRSRMAFEGLYPPRALKDGGKAVPSTGNIFGEPEETRQKFVEDNEIPIYDAAKHEVLLILGCQGGNSPEVQPIVLATGKILDAAGVTWGVLAHESCWGEGLLQSADLMEGWPFHWQEQVANLDEALGNQRDRKLVTICPHCRDEIGVQYKALGAHYTNIDMHTTFFAELMRQGKLKINPAPESMTVHHPCKVIHNDEVEDMDSLLRAAGVSTATAMKSPDVPSCCGGGGGGYLWDSPAKVNVKRFEGLKAVGNDTIVTACSGCHRMLGSSRDEETKIIDVAAVLADRLQAPTE